MEQNRLIDYPGVRLAGWIELVDSYFGSSAHMPVAEGASSQVSASVFGLVARPLNNKAHQIVRQWMVE